MFEAIENKQSLLRLKINLSFIIKMVAIQQEHKQTLDTIFTCEKYELGLNKRFINIHAAREVGGYNNGWTQSLPLYMQISLSCE